MDLSILNEEQKEAVLYKDGPLLVIAGAGSGKTRVLTYKVAYLIEQGVVPSSILCITFTNKATEEMRIRIFELLKNYDISKSPYISTFHGFCRMLLTKYIDELGYTNNYVIYDTSDQTKVINDIKKDLYGDSCSLAPKNILSTISYCKSHNISADEYEKEAYNVDEKRIAKMFYEYNKRLKEQNAVDFDDLLILAVQILKNNKDILLELNNQYKYVLVDEYQDTNEIQFDLISLLTLKNKNITVVGDDDQSIYKFRGADISNILNFEDLFTNAKVVKLTHNYRSNKYILDVANDVIKNNKNRKEKKLWSEIETGDKVSFIEYDSDEDEAYDVVKKISETKNYKDTCILYRSAYLSNKIEKYCKELGVPYKLLSGVSFYQREEVKDILSYLRFIVSSKDLVSFERIIKVPKRGIGDTTIDKIKDLAKENNIDVYEVLLKAKNFSFTDKVKEGINSFVDLIEKLRSENDILNMIQIILDNGYLEHLKSKNEDKNETYDRMQNINEIKNDIVVFKNKINEEEVDGAIDMLTKYLQNVSLYESTDDIVEDAEKLKLMTIHSSKGLEFNTVYIVGLNESIFPSSQSINSGKEEEIEEERRLMYVGCTRAKEYLYLSSARNRFMIGKYVNNLLPSRFVNEISNNNMNKITLGHIYKQNYGFQFKKRDNCNFSNNTIINKHKIDSTERKQMFNSSNLNNIYKKGEDIKKLESLSYKVGDTVSHIKFGEGIVKKIEENEKDFVVTIDFFDEGEKTLFATFAKLEKVN